MENNMLPEYSLFSPKQHLFFTHTLHSVWIYSKAKSGGCPDRALIPTPLSVIFPTLPGDGGKLDTLGLSAGAWNTVYLSCWGMRDGFQLMVRKGQKNRETTNRKKRGREEEKKIETCEKGRLGVFFKWRGRRVGFSGDSWSTDTEDSRKSLNHLLRFPEEQRRHSLVSSVTCSRSSLHAVPNLYLSDEWVHMSSSVSDEWRQREQGGNLLLLRWEMSEDLAPLLNI